MGQAYQVITDRIIGLLEQGTVPWHKPWGGVERQPRSLVSNRNYRGINAFMLSVAGYGSPFWLTYRQAGTMKGNVRRGEKGYPCVYWNWVERNDVELDKPIKVPFLKHYTVFNVEQCEGIEYPRFDGQKRDFQPIAECEKIVMGMPNPPAIENHSSHAFYHPTTDSVHMPSRDAFDSTAFMYGVLFHELIHSTGHKSRLNRRGIMGEIVFGSPTYSGEELIAEMGATYLCGHAGIENEVINNSAAYIDTWLRRIRKDNKILIHSASQAQKAADYVLGVERE
jgi:antirestriction protein ArdC